MERAQAEIARIEERLADPGLYARDPTGFARATDELERCRHDLAALEERWLDLETQREAAGS
jgi:ATP-binding cassette subfamily F protein uup